MNHIYRMVWNDLNPACVTVAEIVKGRGTRGSVTLRHAPCCQRRLDGSLISEEKT
jgi:hypothetical protein